jgi:hypothetical protein
MRRQAVAFDIKELVIMPDADLRAEQRERLGLQRAADDAYGRLSLRDQERDAGEARDRGASLIVFGGIVGL